MRIGIDASRAFQDQKTGTENYSFQMLNHILSLPEANDHEWVVYTRNAPGYISPSPNVLVKNISLPILWTQVGLAYRSWVDGLDVLWVPAHTLPVLTKPGVKTVVTIHGIEYEYLPAYENWLQRWYLPWSTIYATHKASKIISVSQYTAMQLKERLHVDAQKITVVHEGVEAKTINAKPHAILNKYNLQSKKYLLFVGTIQPRKNIKRLVEAFTLLGDAKLKLVIAGKLGWNYHDLPIDQDDNIIFTRYVSEAERYTLLRNALVYVQPSITEGFGLPILEAFAGKVPVVSSTGGALPEVVGPAGLLFSPLDVEELTRQMARLIADSALQKELIAKGLARLKLFSWVRAAKETYSILTQDWG